MSSSKPVLVVMAAGMGSRYGGLKQMDPVGKNGEIIMDYSVYDAMRAGFEETVFIIRKDFEDLFREKIGSRIGRRMNVKYVFQSPERFVPEGYRIPAGRTKPWGTAHAVLCCRDAVESNFAVINADDYYGPNAFRVLYERLLRAEDRNGVYDYCMVGFRLDNTLTDNGSVSRGVCETDAAGRLVDIVERTRVIRTENGPAYLGDDGETWVPVDPGHPVSMNMWGFTPGILSELERDFPRFLREKVPENPEKAEMYLPGEVAKLLAEGRATVDVLSSPDRWYGVTYREDRQGVCDAMRSMTESGLYPDTLF